MNDVGYYLNRKKTFETILARLEAHYPTTDYEERLLALNKELWEELRNHIHKTIEEYEGKRIK